MTFIGEAAALLTYDAFKAASASGTAFGGLLTAARAAAIAGIVFDGALVAGTGLAGFAIGQEILRKLEYTGPEPTVGQSYRVPGNVGNIRVLATFKPKGQPEQNFDNVFASPVFGPVSKLSGGFILQGVLSGPNAVFTQYVGTTRDLIDQPLTITSVAKQNGDPEPTLLKLPGFAPTFPTELPKVPATIPIAPGVPDFPITPTVVPNPNNNPDENDETQKTPGVIVQVPETGSQITFTPTGVSISRFRDPTTTPFEVPSLPPPPTDKKVAPLPCPCPETEPVKLDEVICRLKALESGLLDDGFDYTTTLDGESQGLVVTDIADELVYVGLQVTQVGQQEKTQRSAPGTPTVYFFGWFSWTVGNFPSERRPLSYLNHNLIAPPGATGYTFSLHGGSKAIASHTTRKKRDYVDAC